MKNRKEVAKFIETQFNHDSKRETSREKGYYFHYGKQELRELLDFVYGKEPENKEQELNFTTRREGSE